MEKPILGRYELTDKNQVVIDISIKTVEELYSNFDRTAPYIKKDLDQDFVDYIIDCVREIGDNNFIIRITLTKMPEEMIMERVRGSIQTFFSYLKDVENRAIESMFSRSSRLFIIGLVLLGFSIAANRRLISNESVLWELLTQGITIAAWVSLWEAIANLFVEWNPHKKNISLYERIVKAEVVFRCPPEK